MEGDKTSNITRGLTSITKEILEDAEKEAEKIILRAEAEADRILKNAKEKAERRYNAIIRDGKERIRVKERQMISLFDLESKNRMLRAKEEIINEVFDEALKRLQRYTLTEDYMNCLFRLILEASGQIRSDTLIIRLNERDSKILTEEKINEFSRRMGIKLIKSEETVDCIGGVIVMTPDERIVVDNTFENRLRLLKDSLRVRVAEILFGEGE